MRDYGSIAQDMNSTPKSNLKFKLGFGIFLVALAIVAVVASTGTEDTAALFEDPNDASLDASSWTLSGLLNDGVDGSSGENPLHLKDDDGQKEGPFLRDLSTKLTGAESSPSGIFSTSKPQMLLQLEESTTSLLGDDDWLGAPFAVPEDVRENGEQKIGDEVNYWNTHSGDIGTRTSGYPY